MSYMFSNCRNLQELDMKADTSKVTTMNSMFYNCFRLKEIDLSKLRSDVLTDTSWMFYRCNELTILNIESIDLSTVENKSYSL